MILSKLFSLSKLQLLFCVCVFNLQSRVNTNFKDLLNTMLESVGFILDVQEATEDI